MKLIYLILDPQNKASIEDKNTLKSITGQTYPHTVLKAGVCGDAMRAWKRYSKDYEKMVVILPVPEEDASAIVSDIKRKITTIIGSHRASEGKYYATPIGKYRKLSNASRDLGICQQVLGRWCNHNNKEISLRLRNAHPDLFGNHYTFKQAGFSRTA